MVSKFDHSSSQCLTSFWPWNYSGWAGNDEHRKDICKCTLKYFPSTVKNFMISLSTHLKKSWRCNTGKQFLNCGLAVLNKMSLWLTWYISHQRKSLCLVSMLISSLYLGLDSLAHFMLKPLPVWSSENLAALKGCVNNSLAVIWNSSSGPGATRALYEGQFIVLCLLFRTVWITLSSNGSGYAI